MPELWEGTRGFTAKAKEAVLHAQMEAARFRQGVISSEHLLLGLLRVQGAIGVRILESLGVEPKQLQQEIEKRVPHGEGTVNPEELMKFPMTPEAERALEFAREEAGGLDCPHISTPYLLLGILHLEDAAASDMLRECGVTLAAVRKIVQENPRE